MIDPNCLSHPPRLSEDLGWAGDRRPAAHPSRTTRRHRASPASPGRRPPAAFPDGPPAIRSRSRRATASGCGAGKSPGPARRPADRGATGPESLEGSWRNGPPRLRGCGARHPGPHSDTRKTIRWRALDKYAAARRGRTTGWASTHGDRRQPWEPGARRQALLDAVARGASRAARPDRGEDPPRGDLA